MKMGFAMTVIKSIVSNVNQNKVSGNRKMKIIIYAWIQT